MPMDPWPARYAEAKRECREGIVSAEPVMVASRKLGEPFPDKIVILVRHNLGPLRCRDLLDARRAQMTGVGAPPEP